MTTMTHTIALPESCGAARKKTSTDLRRDLLKAHKITATQAKLLVALAKYPMPTRADDLAVRKFMRTVQVGTYNNLEKCGLIVGRVPAGNGWALTPAGELLVAHLGRLGSEAA